MPGRTRTWSQGDSWNKLAYAYLGDSRKFREIISYNESFDIRVEPTIGVPVFVTGPFSWIKNFDLEMGQSVPIRKKIGF